MCTFILNIVYAVIHCLFAVGFVCCCWCFCCCCCYCCCCCVCVVLGESWFMWKIYNYLYKFLSILYKMVYIIVKGYFFVVNFCFNDPIWNRHLLIILKNQIYKDDSNNFKNEITGNYSSLYYLISECTKQKLEDCEIESFKVFSMLRRSLFSASSESVNIGHLIPNSHTGTKMTWLTRPSH